MLRHLWLYGSTYYGLAARSSVYSGGGIADLPDTLVSAKNLSRMNAAFFTTNAFVSVILFISFSLAVFTAK